VDAPSHLRGPADPDSTSDPADSDFALPTAVSDFNIFILKRFVPEVTGASLVEVIADTGE